MGKYTLTVGKNEFQRGCATVSRMLIKFWTNYHDENGRPRASQVLFSLFHKIFLCEYVFGITFPVYFPCLMFLRYLLSWLFYAFKKYISKIES